MEHISGIIQRIIGSIACPTCESSDQEDGPVPDEKDRKRWIDRTGMVIECPVCDNGTIYWEENWHEGGDNRWSAHSQECEHCDGSGEYQVHDRCETCGRLEMAYGKGPERVSETERIYNDLTY